MLAAPIATATVASAPYGALLAPRAITTSPYDYGSSCYNLDGVVSCANILTGCYGNILAATDYVDAANSCLCASGMPYLNCFASVLSTAGCYESVLGSLDWNSYMLDYFSSTCGSIPPTAMAQMSPPATVSLSFRTVDIVTATGQPPPTPIPEPNYSGAGKLLKGVCTKTDFTLVDAGSTVYFAGFNGCNGDRPECCPWPVATTLASAPTTTAAGTNQDTGNHIGFDFPQPRDSNQATLASCADDYYSVSGGCCPVGYWLFTTEVGGQTPCYSSMNRAATPPTLTAGLAGNPTDTSKPTSAVVNVVWSMRYPVQDQNPGLSTAAKAGIGAGAGVAAILIGVLAICLVRSRRKNKKLQAEKSANGAVAATPVPSQGFPPQPMMQQQAVMPNGQYLQYPPGVVPGMMASAPGLQGPGSMMTNMSTPSPVPLVPQSTGTSNGAVSELSSQTGQGLLHNASPIPRNASFNSSNGVASPGSPPNGTAHPAPIAEADEGQGYRQPQPFPGQGVLHELPQEQQQQQQHPFQPEAQELPSGQQPRYFAGAGQHQSQFYPQQQPPPQFYPQQQQPPQFYPPQQGQQQFYGQQQNQMPPPMHPHQAYYGPGQLQSMHQALPQQMPEMGAGRDGGPPQGVAGGQFRQ